MATLIQTALAFVVVGTAIGVLGALAIGIPVLVVLGIVSLFT